MFACKTGEKTNVFELVAIIVTTVQLNHLFVSYLFVSVLSTPKGTYRIST